MLCGFTESNQYLLKILDHKNNKDAFKLEGV